MIPPSLTETGGSSAIARSINSAKSPQASIRSEIERSVADEEAAQASMIAGACLKEVLSAFRSRPLAFPYAIRPVNLSRS
ncbi:hypothetical protein D3C74_274510 [compost metagenome]